MFQQRHFEAIATVMQETKPHESSENRTYQWEADRTALAALFQRHNKNFMWNRFVAACEPGANVRTRGTTLREST
jgi:hypothetical protein